MYMRNAPSRAVPWVLRLFLTLTVSLTGGRAVAQSCAEIKMTPPVDGPKVITETYCVPANQCKAGYAERAYCLQFQDQCSKGHCEQFESACYALDNENKGVRRAAAPVVPAAACSLFVGTGGQHKTVAGIMCTFTITIPAGKSLGCQCGCDQHIAVPQK